ncbi:hypothetical protein G7Y29_03785 [Corynebacterium qintianiae]|uniref:Uncharacterized protein n=1 Tax=Corynebacterium qintianiae TaxID=2709392 RepID=A0A7T0PGC8_9CORY|nr:hypothetical protein [Corynebacterium qintianiae]QPK83922.1 hypothetical protein G7Y29_03785 [Corynebacterium qintianiae]
MMGIFISDTARNNLASWTINGLDGGYAAGAYLSPFTSPVASNRFKKSAADIAEQIRNAGGEFWFDPMSYVLGMPHAGDFRHYDTWNLWSGTRGDVSSQESRRDHIDRVYKVQESLGSPKLAPSVLVSYPDNQLSQQALELSQEAMESDQSAWLTIAGDQHFWSEGAVLDAHVGALDQLEPAGWLLVVGRSDSSMPPAATANEIFGLMRTTYALSQDRPVRVAFGDLAALPAVAAGAEGICTGWDLRQRICAYKDFEERGGDQSGGGWYNRPTLRGLMGGLTKREYETLLSENADLAARLTPGAISPKIEPAFKHHAETLGAVISELLELCGRTRVEALRDRYILAYPEWDKVERITNTSLGPERWIKPFLEGLNKFRSSEGWC